MGFYQRRASMFQMLSRRGFDRNGSSRLTSPAVASLGSRNAPSLPIVKLPGVREAWLAASRARREKFRAAVTRVGAIRHLSPPPGGPLARSAAGSMSTDHEYSPTDAASGGPVVLCLVTIVQLVTGDDASYRCPSETTLSNRAI